MKLLVLFVLCFLVGCGTYKGKTTSKTDKTTGSSVSILQTEIDYASLLDSVTTYLKQHVHINHTEYYPRDSTGNQELKSKTEIDINSGKKETHISDKKSGSNTNTEINKSDVTKENTAEFSEKKVDTGLFNSEMIVIMVVVFLIFFRKKYFDKNRRVQI